MEEVDIALLSQSELGAQESSLTRAPILRNGVALITDQRRASHSCSQTSMTSELVDIGLEPLLARR